MRNDNIWIFADNAVGVHAARRRDAHLCRPYRPNAIQDEEETLSLHIGKSTCSEATVWHEGNLDLELGFEFFLA